MLVSIVKTGMALLMAAMLSVGNLASADEVHDGRYVDFNKQIPSAVLEFNVSSAKLLLGVSWGDGILYYQGEAYPVKVSGMSAGGIGFQKTKGVGEVYYLDSLKDLPGTYKGGVLGATVGKGKGIATIENSKSVIIRVSGISSGLALNASAGGMKIEFVN